MRTDEFDFELPPELIAQAPALQRDQSRLLVLHRDSGQIAHRRFADLPEYLRAGDVLVLNNSRVIPARLRASNAKSGGRFEVFLLEENHLNDWWAMMRPGKRARVGTSINLLDAQGRPTVIRATVTETNAEGHRRLRFVGSENIQDELEWLGEVPLPPYITRADTGRMARDRERYQTVFAQPPGSVAAPTAGLHFTESLLAEIRSRGVQVCFVTLHVGLGTFAPVKAATIAGHFMHEERFDLSEESARIINDAKQSRRRVIAVGTTSVRVLESVASEARIPNVEENPQRQSEKPGSVAPPILYSAPGIRRPISQAALSPDSGKTRIFIYPPRNFEIVDAMLTNFHLPRSTLLMLVSAFAAPNSTRGREIVLSAYAEAIGERYRFFSYGDAMLVI